MDADAIMRAVEHRQYPLPHGPWIMTQTWHDLMFVHWPVSPVLLRPLIPDLLEIDTFEGEAWLGVVPFRMSNVRPRGVPAINGLSHFPELNVRTYVQARGIPGVVFFSLDAGNPIAVQLARSLFHLPYFNALMTCQRTQETIQYRSQRSHRGAPAADFIASYRPISAASSSARDTLPYWLTERYCLYTTYHKHLYRADIQHRPWSLQAGEIEIQRNTMVEPYHLHLPDTQPLLHYADLQEVLVWPLQCVI